MLILSSQLMHSYTFYFWTLLGWQKKSRAGCRRARSPATCRRRTRPSASRLAGKEGPETCCSLAWYELAFQSSVLNHVAEKQVQQPLDRIDHISWRVSFSRHFAPYFIPTSFVFPECLSMKKSLIWMSNDASNIQYDNLNSCNYYQRS